VPEKGCCLKRHPELGVRQLRWSFKRIIEPIPEITVGKQVQTKQRHQAAKRQVALRAKLEILEQQHGNQCCPNLCFESIGAGTDEGLDLQMLFEHLEEEFDLPAIPIDTGDGGGPKAKVIGEKLDLPLVLLIPDDYPPQQPGILQTGLVFGETDDLVGKDIGSLGQRAVLHHFINGIALEPGDEEDAGFIPLGEEIEVVVAPIDGDNAAGGKGKMTSHSNIGCLPLGDHGEIGQIPVMIQEEMELDSALGLAEVSPGEKAETKVDGGRIEAEQLVLETEFPLLSRALAAEEITQVKENLLIQLPGTMGIGVRKGALGRGGMQSQMTELAAGDGQAVADLPQTLALGHLTKQHGDVLVPGGEPLGMAFRPALMNQPPKRKPGHHFEDLTEQTCSKLHDRDSFEVFGVAYRFHHITSGSLFSITCHESYLGQVCPHLVSCHT